MQCIRKRDDKPHLQSVNEHLWKGLSSSTSKFQGESSRPVHKEHELLEQQPKQHVNYTKIFVNDDCEETHGMQERLGSAQQIVMMGRIK